jgi:hypothetical protein
VVAAIALVARIAGLLIDQSVLGKNRRVKQCIGRTGANKTGAPLLRFIFDLLSAAKCDLTIVSRPFIANIGLYGNPYHKGLFIIFSRKELVNFPVFGLVRPNKFCQRERA